MYEHIKERKRKKQPRQIIFKQEAERNKSSCRCPALIIII